MTQRRRALITGITGQDGSYLAELLLSKDYEVHGLMRRASTFNTGRIEHLSQERHGPNARLLLHYGDMTDGSALTNLVLNVEPDEIYNLAAQSHVRVSFDLPLYTVDVDAMGTLRMLEAARQLNRNKAVRVLPGVVQRDVRPGGRNAAERSGLRSIPAAPTPAPRSTVITRRSTTARRTDCTSPTAFCSTTSRLGAARPSSPER